NRYTVHTDNGRFMGKSVIVTVPLNVLNSLEFKPELSKGKQKAALEGQVSRGIKVWAKLRGRFEPFVAIAPSNYPLTTVHLEYAEESYSLIVAFGPDAKR